MVDKNEQAVQDPFGYIVYLTIDRYVLCMATEDYVNKRYPAPLFKAKIPNEVFEDNTHYKFFLKVDGGTPSFSYEPKTEVELLRDSVENLARLYAYSAAIDSNKVHGMEIVFNGDLRDKLKARLDNEEALGKSDVTLYFNGEAFPGKISDFRKMLLAINVRADRNFDVFQGHLAAINKLSTVEALKAYDYKTGYEPALEF